MIKIVKVLNNNVVVILNDRGLETVVMGRGLAFQKNLGTRLGKARLRRSLHSLGGR